MAPPSLRLAVRTATATLSPWLFAVACHAAPPAGSAHQEASTAPTNVAATARPPLELATAPAATPEGTWLFTCCDGASTWIGMLTLVETGAELHGAWITDGDSAHGSYVEGSFDGTRVHLTRRWITGTVTHTQEYDLALDASGNTLAGTFVEPAFDPRPHGITFQRGFSKNQRRSGPGEAAAHEVVIDPAPDPKRPCNCALVCHCGGVAPGPEHYAESARCGGSCRCRPCPPNIP